MSTYAKNMLLESMLYGVQVDISEAALNSSKISQKRRREALIVADYRRNKQRKAAHNSSSGSNEEVYVEPEELKHGSDFKSRPLQESVDGASMYCFENDESSNEQLNTSSSEDAHVINDIGHDGSLPYWLEQV